MHKLNGWMNVYHNRESGRISFDGPHSSKPGAEAMAIRPESKHNMFKFRDYLGAFEFKWNQQDGFTA